MTKKKSKDNMFQKAGQEDINKKKEGGPPKLTLSQKHKITKKRGDPKSSQVLGDKKNALPNFLSAAQFSNRQERQMEVTSYPRKDVIHYY